MQLIDSYVGRIEMDDILFCSFHETGFCPAINYIAITLMIQEFETTKKAGTTVKTCPKEKK
jgi:hypothetical protein